MKNLTRITLFFSVLFAAVLLTASAIRYLHVWIDAVRHIPVKAVEIFPSLILAGQWALPIAMYVSILLTLSYSVRKSFSSPLSILVVFILSCGFTAGVYLGLFQANSTEPLPGTSVPPALGKPGLILTEGDTAVVLMDAPSNPEVSLVMAVPNQPLTYQEIPMRPVTAGVTLPTLPFRIETPLFMSALFIDFSLMAEQFHDRMSEGLIPFGIYLGAVCFLLSSLRFVLELTSWPLANLFVGILVFRGILAAGTFLDSWDIQEFIPVYLKADVPQSFITPLVFCGAAVLVILYTALVRLIRGRRTS
ncbi:MAG: hypothetical protein LBH70_09895 [Spirochaetaceae bacterium]|nr:hypothetical protein [Spirochaetaceae bacterium]